MDQENKSVIDEIIVIVKLLRTGQIVELIKRMSDLVNILKKLGQQNDQQKLKETMIVVRAILESFQRKDYVLMADLLEYEVIPRMVN